MNKLVVTRHQGLVQYLKEIKLIDEDTKVITYAKPEDVVGCHVIGVLPHWLSSKAEKYTEIQMRLPPELRNRELDYETIKFYASNYSTYIVKEVDFE